MSDEVLFALALSLKRTRHEDQEALLASLRDMEVKKQAVEEKLRDTEKTVLFNEYKILDRDRDVVELQTRYDLLISEHQKQIAQLKEEQAVQIGFLKEQLDGQKSAMDKVGKLERHAFAVSNENQMLQQRISIQVDDIAVAYQARTNRARRDCLAEIGRTEQELLASAMGKDDVKKSFDAIRTGVGKFFV